MSVTQNLLANENVVFESKKHWISPVRDSLIAALMVIGGLFLWSWNPRPEGFFSFFGTFVAWVRWGLLIVGIAWIVYNIVAWRTAQFAVTTLRVLRYEGLLQKRASETLLSAVTDVKLNVPFLGGRLGYGDLKIFTQSGDAGADDFTSITNPAEFRSRMMAIKIEDEAARRAPVQAPVAAQPAPVAPPAAPGAAAAAAPAAGNVVAAAPAVSTTAEQVDDQADRLVKLAELRDQGVITAEEFEAKKAEILSRI